MVDHVSTCCVASRCYVRSGKAAINPEEIMGPKGFPTVYEINKAIMKAAHLRYWDGMALNHQTTIEGGRRGEKRTTCCFWNGDSRLRYLPVYLAESLPMGRLFHRRESTISDRDRHDFNKPVMGILHTPKEVEHNFFGDCPTKYQVYLTQTGRHWNESGRVG